ncbi:hypothetical protein R1flu_012537 [Riccia fluitans]|uniref:Uncharacterized protein n=1 Tax=Riccia fluitans TaxID=41844 RepID=A0ABD1ZB27_9MARC
MAFCIFEEWTAPRDSHTTETIPHVQEPFIIPERKNENGSQIITIKLPAGSVQQTRSFRPEEEGNSDKEKNVGQEDIEASAL